MSYQVLARKWRPHNFHEMVGQTHVLRALINALDNQRLHHAYLFTGTRGVGKTTISRILTKCLNCEQGVSSTPCGVCTTCLEIDEGRFIDLIEVDGASRTKVEDTRELLENIQYAPTKGRYKVYLIDEVHMLSSHSFNALLKTLEEPPPHVKFLLATTDPQKLPVTILSRCLQFALKNIAADRIIDHLAHVLEAEKIPYEKEALWLLGRAADGSMRDAMSLTDQAIAFSGERVNTTDVRDMLGTLDQKQVYELLFALLEGDTKKLLDTIKQLSEQSPDWLDVLGELLNVLHRIAIAQALPDAIDDNLGDKEQILALAHALPAEDIQFYYQVGLIGRRDLPLAPTSHQGFEMVLLRMLAFRPANSQQAPITPLKKIEPTTLTTEKKTVESSLVTAPNQSIAKTVEVKTTPQPIESINTALPEVEAPANALSEKTTTSLISVAQPQETNEEVSELITTEKDIALSAAETTEEQPPAYITEDIPLVDDEYISVDEYSSLLEESYSETTLTAETTQTEPTNFLPPATGLAAKWLEIFPELKLTGITGSIASNCTLVAMNDTEWQLQLDPQQQALFSDNQKKRISDAINQYLGNNVNLKIDIQTPAQETPAQREQRNRYEKQKSAEQSIYNDPLIQQMLEQFSATIHTESIKPLQQNNTSADDK